MEYRDYYNILGVDRNAKPEEIKRAYRKMARKYHPDVSKEPAAEERFKEVQEAYEVLKDAQKRQAYDQLGSNWKSGQEFRPPPGWQGFGGFDGGSAGFHGGESVDFSDFFASLFGGQRGAGPFGGRQRPQRGRDEQARIAISMEEAFTGGSRTIQLQTQTHRGRPPEVRTLKINLPAGILPGQKLRLAGQGSPGANGQAGDLYLEIEILPHKLFTLDGQHVLLTLPVTPWECALGSTITVPTLGGRVDVKIAKGSQSGQKLRLKGRGFPGKTPGDQYVVLKIMTPPADTDTRRAFYEKMATEMPFNPREGF